MKVRWLLSWVLKVNLKRRERQWEDWRKKLPPLLTTLFILSSSTIQPLMWSQTDDILKEKVMQGSNRRVSTDFKRHQRHARVQLRSVQQKQVCSELFFILHHGLNWALMSFFKNTKETTPRFSPQPHPPHTRRQTNTVGGGKRAAWGRGGEGGWERVVWRLSLRLVVWTSRTNCGRSQSVN